MHVNSYQNYLESCILYISIHSRSYLSSNYFQHRDTNVLPLWQQRIYHIACIHLYLNHNIYHMQHIVSNPLLGTAFLKDIARLGNFGFKDFITFRQLAYCLHYQQSNFYRPHSLAFCKLAYINESLEHTFNFICKVGISQCQHYKLDCLGILDSYYWL